MTPKNPDNPYAPPETHCSPQSEIHEKLVLKKLNWFGKILWVLSVSIGIYAYILCYFGENTEGKPMPEYLASMWHEHLVGKIFIIMILAVPLAPLFVFPRAIRYFRLFTTNEPKISLLKRISKIKITIRY